MRPKEVFTDKKCTASHCEVLAIRNGAGQSHTCNKFAAVGLLH